MKDIAADAERWQIWEHREAKLWSVIDADALRRPDNFWVCWGIFKSRDAAQDFVGALRRWIIERENPSR
jgi:hypothetical protein